MLSARSLRPEQCPLDIQPRPDCGHEKFLFARSQLGLALTARGLRTCQASPYLLLPFCEFFSEVGEDRA